LSSAWATCRPATEPPRIMTVLMVIFAVLCSVVVEAEFRSLEETRQVAV
jgi:hypothetical protein